MKLNQIEYMYEVSRCGSITAAATKLFVTQPTLSQQIMNLEKEVGVRLFIRQPRSILLTPAGEEFLVYARRILSNVSNLTAAMEDYSMLRKGKIRIGMLSTFGCLNIIDKLAIFKKENPEIQTIITVTESKTLVEMLASHELDVAFFMIATAFPQIPDLRLIKLFDNEMIVLLPQGHPLAQKERVGFSDLRDENIIMPAETSSLYEPIHAAFLGAGVEPNVICEASRPELFIQMVSSGMGIAFASERVAFANRHYGCLYRPLGARIAQSIYFAVLQDSYDIPVIQRFSNYIQREYERPQVVWTAPKSEC